MYFNYKPLQQDTKDTIWGLVIFLITIPLAIMSHWFARFYGIMGLTITGWGFALLGGISLGMVVTNRRLWNLSGR